MQKIYNQKNAEVLVLSDSAVEVLQPIFEKMFGQDCFLFVSTHTPQEARCFLFEVEKMNQYRRCKDLRDFIKENKLPLLYLKYQVEMFQKIRKFLN